MLRREDSGQVKSHGRAVAGGHSYLLFLLFATGRVAADDGHIVVVRVEDAGGPEQEVPRTPAGVPVDHIPTQFVARAHCRRSSSIGSRLTLHLSPRPIRDGTDDHHKQTQVCRTERRPRLVEFTGPGCNCPTQDGNYMELSIQSVLLNVTNLNQSIAFYQDVFDFRLTSQRDEVAALMVYETKRRQVILLRELGRNWHGAGRRSVGLRMLSFEAGTPNELGVIEQMLVERQALVWQGQTEAYRALMGVDPDRTQICVASSLTGTPISSDNWKDVDDAIYTIG